MARTKAKQRHISWDLLDVRIRQGPPSLEPIRGTPKAVMFIEPGGSRIGLRMSAAAGELPPSPLAEVSIRRVGSGSAAAVEVATSKSELYREFYAFCCDVVDRVQLDGHRVSDALAETLRRWASLLRRKAIMPEDRQIGLLGELWFLQQVATKRGWRFAGDAWRGPESEEHDFTLTTVDVEVKTTRSETRVHTIGSLTQLLPKPGRPLFVLSVQLTHVGKTATSMSLPRMVASALTKATAADGATASTVRAQIDAYGWNDDDAQHYPQEWALRSPPALILVDRRFPAIVPATLKALGKERMSRIGRVVYDARLDELGVLQGTRQFSSVIDR
jgi:hypothetical protein